MSVLHVERVSGRYIEPEIVDLDDGLLFRIHEYDVGEAGAAWLAWAFEMVARAWALRPAGSPPGPVVPVRFEADDLPEPLAILLDDKPQAVTYTVDQKDGMLTRRAADKLSRLATERTPYWQRIPQQFRERLITGR